MSAGQCLASHPCGFGWSAACSAQHDTWRASAQHDTWHASTERDTAACRAEHDTWYATPYSGRIYADETGLRRGISRVPAAYSTALRLSRAQCAVARLQVRLLATAEAGVRRALRPEALLAGLRWCERSDGHRHMRCFVRDQARLRWSS